MQRVITRFGLPATIVGITAVLAIAASSLILAWGYRNQLVDLKAVIHARCQQRLRYDEAQQQSRAALLGYYRHLQANLALHPSGQRAAFDRQLTADIHRVTAGLTHALQIGAPSGCQQFK